MADTARDDLQRQADGYVRQGRLDAAIGAFEQLVQLPPTDWNFVKQLADLQERAGHREAAATRFLECADYYFGEGFLARAAALYRKVLKLDPKSEHALGKLADVSLELKLKMDARQALSQLVALHRERGNVEGAQQAGARLAALDGDEVRIRAPRAHEPRVEPAPEPAPAPPPAPAPEPVREPEPARVPEPARAPDAQLRPHQAPPPPHPDPQPEPAPRSDPPEPEPAPQSDPEQARAPVRWDVPEPRAAAIPPDGRLDVSDDWHAGSGTWNALLSDAQPSEPAPWTAAELPTMAEGPVERSDAPPPVTDLGAGIATGAFDWGALLGRDVGTAPPVAAASRPVPDDVSADLRARVEAAAPGEEVEVQEVGEIAEIDLTDLLDQLAADRMPTGATPIWQSAATVPAPPDARPDPAPAAAPEPAPDDAPTSRIESPAAEAAFASIEALALAGIANEAQSDADPRAVAARQLAAGRVFAAAGLVAEAARAFERASRDVRTRFEAAEALGTLHRSRGQMSEAVRWYDEASQAPVADEAVRRPVLYDLADVLEAVGQPGRALAILLELLSDVDDYRDARARAERLLRVDAGG